MPLISFPPTNFLRYFLKREANQFFTSVAIRSLALGMVVIFEPIYLYNFFGHSLSLTLLFFGAIQGLYGLLAVWGAKFMARVGLKHSILFSHVFFWAYYMSLFLIGKFFLFVPLAIVLKAVGMTLFWPAFHTDFIRFSENDYQGRAVGKMNVVFSIPTILSPAIGGAILGLAGYQALFISVLIVLFASSIPMFLSRETHVVYSDSYKKAWSRLFKKENWRATLAFASSSMEAGVREILWPIFMFVLAISFTVMGGITTLALGVGSLFVLYMGRISDSISNRVWFLNIGSVLTSMAWIIKYFVLTPFDAFLAKTLYGICRSTADIPFQTFFYKKASLKRGEADEFIVYRTIVLNLSYFFFFSLLALLFLFTAKINIAFLIAAVVSLGIIFLGVPPKLKW